MFPPLTAGILLGCAALTVGLSARAETQIPENCRTGGFFIGCQAYTFNRFTVFEAIEKTAQAGGKVIEFYPGQKLSRQETNVSFSHSSPADVLQKVQEKLAQHKVKAVNYGVVSVPNDEPKARMVFEFAKAMGIRAITTESTDAIDTMEKLAKEFDIMVGFHNHPKRPNDANYKVWDPNYILSLVKDRDTRIGAAADTGHWVRSGLNPLDCLRLLKGRLVSSHLKDLNEMGMKAHDMPYGTGISGVPAILEELKAQNFQGNISIEYEYNWDNSLPEVAQCIGFVRGYGIARKW